MAFSMIKFEELIGVLRLHKKAFVRLMLRQTEEGWILYAMLADVKPSATRLKNFVSDYGSVTFLGSEVPVARIESWLEKLRGKVNGYNFRIPQLQENVFKDRFPSNTQTTGLLYLPLPFDLFQIPIIGKTNWHRENAPLVSADLQSFHNLEAAAYHFFYDREHDPGQALPDTIYIRLVRPEAWIEQAELIQNELVVTIKGTNVEGARLEISGPPGINHDELLKSAGTHRFQLSEVTAAKLHIFLTRDGEWLDLREISLRESSSNFFAENNINAKHLLNRNLSQSVHEPLDETRSLIGSPRRVGRKSTSYREQETAGSVSLSTLNAVLPEIPSFIDSDNEARVRESLVAPLLRAMGYRDEEIAPEVPLIFVTPTTTNGKNQTPWIRADYVVTAEHEFLLPANKIVVEVKRPSVPVIDDEILDQARGYANHRNVQATYIVLVNGIDLLIHSGTSLERLRHFRVARLKDHWEEMVSILGPKALSRHFAGLQITRELGSGGYGRVFEAVNSRLVRTEALKILHPGAEQAMSWNRRFDKGAQGAARLNHQYICEVYDLATWRGRPYVRMELIHGSTVTEYISQHNLSVDEKISLFTKVCEALSYAHGNGVFHCDLKPANILVRPDGLPKLIDFDFCHIGSGVSTIPSQIVATIAYMDPTILNNFGNRDHLADVYSAGLLLWSILTGMDLEPGWTPLTLKSELEALGDDYRGFVPLIIGCLQENRGQRPQSIESVLKFLRKKTASDNMDNMIEGAVSSFSTNSPAREFEYHFKLWVQTNGNDFPSAARFRIISKGIPQRLLTDNERHFIFLAASVYWEVQCRQLFENWATDDLLKAAKIVLDDKRLNSAYGGQKSTAHPAYNAILLVKATDDYRERKDSEKVAEFLLDWLYQEKRSNIFGTILGNLPYLKCFKSKSSTIRTKASRTLIRLIHARLPRGDKSIGQLLEILSPDRCGEDSSEVAKFLHDLTTDQTCRDRAIKTLACLKNSTADDAFISLLESTQGTKEFEKIAAIAIGISGRHKRMVIAEYLARLPNYPDCLSSAKLIEAVNILLEKNVQQTNTIED